MEALALVLIRPIFAPSPLNAAQPKFPTLAERLSAARPSC